MADFISNVRADENEAERQIRNMKKIVTTATNQVAKENKRSALGELGNRVHKIAAEKKEKDFKNVKPRVDTHWKKSSTTAGQPRTILTRSESMKVLLPAPTALAAPAAVRAVSKPASTKTTINNLKLIKNKISKSTTNNTTASATTITITSIKREESRLTRRSLSKLKAAFMRDASPVKVRVEPTTVFSPETHSSKLLEQIENIDSKDDLNPLLMSEYVNEIYVYLNKLELDFPVTKDHLDGQSEITPRMRAVLVDWINEVHYQFKLEIETYHMTVSIIDRYLQAMKNVPRKQLQLVGVAALFIASKYEELYPPEINDYVFIADDAYTKQQILDMEKQIVRILDFQLGKPLPIHFLRRYSKAAKAETEHHMMSKYLIELASVEYTMAHYRPSEIAAAALYLSLKVLNKYHTTQTPKWTTTLQHYTTYKTSELKPVVQQLALLAKNASGAKQKAVYNKYALAKFDRISMRAEINTGTVIEQILREAAASP